jgi:hypothetical protein
MSREGILRLIETAVRLSASPSLQSVAFSHGLIRYSGSSFHILCLHTGRTLLAADLDWGDDSIARISVIDHQTLCFCSFSGQFSVYRLNVSESTLRIEKAMSARSREPCFVLNFAVSMDFGVVFCFDGGSSVACVNFYGTWRPLSFSHPEIGTDTLCHVINSESTEVLQTDGAHAFCHRNWGNSQAPPVWFDVLSSGFMHSKSADSFSLNRDPRVDLDPVSEVKITALTSFIMPRSGARVTVAGVSDGTCYFFNGSGSSTHRSVLLSAVVGIVFLPAAFTGHIQPYLLAIGADGSCALIVYTKVSLTYLTNGFPVVAVFADFHQHFLVVETVDGLFTTYNMVVPDPLGLNSYRLPAIEKLWSVNTFESNDGSAVVNELRIGSSSAYFTLIRLDAHLRAMANSPQPWDRHLEFLYLLMNPASNPRPLIQLSYVLIGANNSFTFFYPPYRFSGPTVFQASASQAAMHLKAYCLLVDHFKVEFGLFKGDAASAMLDILPSLIDLMFTENAQIQATAMTACASAIGCISESQAKIAHERLVGPMQSISDVFVLGTIFVSHPGLFAQGEREVLTLRLLDIAAWPNCTGSLAIILLLKGLADWILPPKKLFTMLLKIMGRREVELDPLCMQLLSLQAGLQPVAFIESVREVVDEAPSLENAKKMFRLLTEVSTHNRSIGTQGTLAMMLMTLKHKALCDLAERELVLHCKAMTNVVQNMDSIAIGMSDGKVHVFLKKKGPIVTELFNAAVDVVSIGPRGSCIAAISYDVMESRMFQMPKNGSDVTGAVQVRQLQNENVPSTILWKGPNEWTVVAK